MAMALVVEEAGARTAVTVMRVEREVVPLSEGMVMVVERQAAVDTAAVMTTGTEWAMDAQEEGQTTIEVAANTLVIASRWEDTTEAAIPPGITTDLTATAGNTIVETRDAVVIAVPRLTLPSEIDSGLEAVQALDEWKGLTCGVVWYHPVVWWQW